MNHPSSSRQTTPLSPSACARRPQPDSGGRSVCAGQARPCARVAGGREQGDMFQFRDSRGAESLSPHSRSVSAPSIRGTKRPQVTRFCRGHPSFLHPAQGGVRLAVLAGSRLPDAARIEQPLRYGGRRQIVRCHRNRCNAIKAVIALLSPRVEPAQVRTCRLATCVIERSRAAQTAVEIPPPWATPMLSRRIRDSSLFASDGPWGTR